MKKLLLVIFFLVSLLSFSQESEARITITFDAVSMVEAIAMIEAKTDYRFYFIEDWFTNTAVSGTFQEVTLQELLEEILKDTLFNYNTIEDTKVILTKYNRIYNELPNGFFEPEVITNTTKLNTIEKAEAPIFYNQNSSQVSKKIETVRIGKENKSSPRNTFVLEGTITNITNGGEAHNVAITVAGNGIGTVTNQDGSYRISLPKGMNVITASSLVFQDVKKRIILYNDGVLDFGLSEALEGLDEVVIQGNINQVLKEVSAGVTKVDVEQIKNVPLVLGERDIFKVAATMPGISSAGEGAEGYNVRGGKVDENLILLDDGVIYNPSHFFGIFSAINPFSTDEVTIYKGHVPAEYGGRLSSVFDIRTQDASVDKLAGEASIGLVTSNVLLEVPVVKEKAGLLVGIRATYSDIILRNLDNEELEKSEASFYDAILKYYHEINDKNSIRATGYFSRDDFSITSDSVFGYSNRMASLRWDHTFDEKNKGAFIVSNTQYKFDIEFDGQTNRNFELGYKVNETELKLNLVYKANSRHKINYGLSTKLYGIEPGFIRPLGDNSQVILNTIADEQALESALFISDIFKVTDRFSVEAGIRFSFFAALGASTQNVYEEDAPKNDGSLVETREYGSGEFIKTYGYPEFRIASRYLLTPELSIKAGVNTSAQYIHRLSTNTTAAPIDTWKLSDLNIKPQRAVQYSVGVFKNFKENMYELSAEGYYKRSKDILDYKVGAELLLNEELEQEVLQGEGKAYGIEFLLKKTSGKFSGWLAYTYARSFVKLDSDFAEERVNNGDFFRSNYDRPHDVSFVGNFKLTERFSLSGNFVYQTGRPVTVPTGNFIVDNVELLTFSDRNEFRIPDYYRLDLGFNVEGNHKKNKLAHSFWNISVYNVLGRNNPYSVFFVNEGGEIKAKQASIFTVPVPTISYNIKF
jgi:hypothetical protein